MSVACALAREGFQRPVPGTSVHDTDAAGDEAARTPAYDRVDVSVLVVGAGAAGARTAIELAERGVEDVLVLGKRDHGDAHTTWACGGMTGHTEPVGTPSDAVRDALDEGHELDYQQLE